MKKKDLLLGTPLYGTSSDNLVTKSLNWLLISTCKRVSARMVTDKKRSWFTFYCNFSSPIFLEPAFTLRSAVLDSLTT